jgi:hypothetical protein
MWTYSQSTGAVQDASGKCVATGYSGYGAGVNDPDLQNVVDIGPIPRGLWSIGAPRSDEHLGPFCMPSIPHADTSTFGRDGFFIHGDEIGHVGEHLASHGCIILDRATREAIWASGDHILKVTA